MELIKKLNRFTTLPILMDMLERKKLVLLNPASWDDKNDTQIILEYQRQSGQQNLFALCFTHYGETIHHWKTFANGPSGCCIEFSARKLFDIFKGTPQLRHGKVAYKRINEAKPAALNLAQIPFTKRQPYKFENEYRIIWEGKTEQNFIEFDLPLETINRITFSQQMPDVVFQSIKSLLIKTYPLLRRKIYHSTIYRNDIWIDAFTAK